MAVAEVVVVALQEEVATISSAESLVVSPRMAVVEAAVEEEVEMALRVCKLKVLLLMIQKPVLNTF